MKYFLLLSFTIATSWMSAQDFKEGRVLYDETMNLRFEMDEEDPQMAQVRAMLPTSRKYGKELLFKDGKSLFRDLDLEEGGHGSDNISAGSEDGGVQMQIEIARPENIIFQDWINKSVIQKREFMGRDFLVQGTKERKWKISNETKEIAGYTCQKAILDDTTATEAWFTSEIPLYTGPESFNGLPGLIMELSLEDGRRIVSASDVILEPINEEIKAPTKGKKVSPDQFYAIVEEKMKEMQNEYGGSGRMIMIREDN